MRSDVAGWKLDRRLVLDALRQREDVPVAEVVHDRAHPVPALVVGHELQHVDEPPVD
jgi:hypothetical protein